MGATRGNACVQAVIDVVQLLMLSIYREATVAGPVQMYSYYGGT